MNKKEEIQEAIHYLEVINISAWQPEIRKAIRIAIETLQEK